jgi:hypothetical protein
MKMLSLLLGIILVASARAQSLRLILVPQQIEISPAASRMKFDLFLYNASDSVQTVPSLDEFRAFYTTYHHANSDSKSATDIRAFNHPIKDHTLKAQRVDHANIEIDLSSEDGDYIELRVAIGHDERTITSNSVLLLCHPVRTSPAEPPQSPKAEVTPK